MLTRVILDEHDTNELLRVLYNGPRPARVHTLVCVCGAVADLRVSERAWNGWRVLPHPMCPTCLEAGRGEALFAPPYPLRALVRFTRLAELLDREAVE